MIWKKVCAGLAIGCPLAIMVFVFAFVVFLFLIKLVWAWTIPDLFPGAVEQGLVAGTIGWFTAVKLALLVAVLSAIAGHSTQVKS